MSVAVQLLPGLEVIAIHVDGDAVFLRRDLCTEFLAKFMRAMADSIPESEVVFDNPTAVVPFPGHSVRVPEVAS